MMLARVLHAEMLKLKRTIALKVVVIAPAVIVGLVFFIASQAPYSTIGRVGVNGQWAVLERSNLRFWGFLMLPLYMALQTALLAGLDHSNNQWKSLCARPVARWTLYVAKLIVTLGMTAVSSLLLALGIVTAGLILPHLHTEPRFVFSPPVPWGPVIRDAMMMIGLACVALAIQHWVSLRWRSFSVAMGTGIVATIAGIFATAAGAQAGGWAQYFPWAMPMLVQSPQAPNLEVALLAGCAVAALIVAAGCWEFSRREIQ